MADDETFTAETITTAQWLRIIKPILKDFAADRQIQEREWFSEHPKILSPTEMICRLEGYCFRDTVADPSSREVADLSDTQRASCLRFADLVDAFARHAKGIFLERDVINDPEWDKLRAAAKELVRQLYPET